MAPPPRSTPQATGDEKTDLLYRMLLLSLPRFTLQMSFSTCRTGAALAQSTPVPLIHLSFRQMSQHLVQQLKVREVCLIYRNV